MSTINITRGSDVSMTLTWRDDDQLPINLTGMTLNLLDVSLGIQGKISGVISDAANGKTVISLEGTSPIKAGSYKFRVQLTSSGGIVTINVTGGTIPTYKNGTSATTNIVSSINITLTGLKTNSEVRVYTNNTGQNDQVINGVENSGTSFSFSAEPGQIINIMINHLNYLPADIWQFTVPSDDVTIPISQFIDRQYQNL